MLPFQQCIHNDFTLNDLTTYIHILLYLISASKNFILFILNCSVHELIFLFSYYNFFITLFELTYILIIQYRKDATFKIYI